MKKLAVYTCIAGGYDSFPQHPAIHTEADYWCFVAKGEKTSDRIGVWRIVELDEKQPSPTLLCRYAKTHPRILLPDYEYTLWVDANVDIMQNGLFEVIDEKMVSGILLSGIRHPETDCAYEEAVRVVHKGREKTARVLRMICFLHHQGLPRHYGLFETGVLLRRSGGDASVHRFDACWWALISRISCRDQLSFSFCMKQAGLAWDTLVPAGADVRNHPFFSYRTHSVPPPKRSFLYRKTHGLLVALTRWYAER